MCNPGKHLCLQVGTRTNLTGIGQTCRDKLLDQLYTIGFTNLQHQLVSWYNSMDCMYHLKPAGLGSHQCEKSLPAQPFPLFKKIRSPPVTMHKMCIYAIQLSLLMHSALASPRLHIHPPFPWWWHMLLGQRALSALTVWVRRNEVVHRLTSRLQRPLTGFTSKLAFT